MQTGSPSENERSSLPTATEIRRLRDEHISLAAERLTTAIGKRLWRFQWEGELGFDDLLLDPSDEKALIISRLSERDLIKVIHMIEENMDAAGYCYDVDLVKYKEHPFFHIRYFSELKTQEDVEEVSGRGSEELASLFDSDSETGSSVSEEEVTTSSPEDLLVAWDM
jgi:hypothetical protein